MSGRDEKPKHLLPYCETTSIEKLGKRFLQLLRMCNGERQGLGETHVRRWFFVQPQLRTLTRRQKIDFVNEFFIMAQLKEVIIVRNGRIYTRRNVDEWSR